MSSASHVGREAEVQALGQAWRLARWERHVWEALTEWARARAPDPLEVAKKALALYPPHMHDGIVRYAIQLASQAPASNSPLFAALLASLECDAHALWLLLKPNHPGVTEEEAWAIAAEVPTEVLKAAFARCQGRLPEGAGPNGQAPAGKRPSRGRR